VSPEGFITIFLFLELRRQGGAGMRKAHIRQRSENSPLKMRRARRNGPGAARGFPLYMVGRMWLFIF